MVRNLLFLLLVVFLFGGTTWLIFFILNLLGVTPWPSWLPH
jgi:hypothetical protein